MPLIISINTCKIQNMHITHTYNSLIKLNECWIFLSRNKHKTNFFSNHWIIPMPLPTQGRQIQMHSLHLKLGLLPIEFTFGKFTIDIPQLFFEYFNLQMDYRNTVLQITWKCILWKIPGSAFSTPKHTVYTVHVLCNTLYSVLGYAYLLWRIVCVISLLSYNYTPPINNEYSGVGYAMNSSQIY